MTAEESAGGTPVAPASAARRAPQDRAGHDHPEHDRSGHDHPEHGHRFGSSDHADSAGESWAGRSFEPNPHAGDDGRVDPAVGEAIRAHDVRALVEALRTARLLVPLLAEAGTVGRTASGRIVEKTQELAIVKVAGPGGRPTLPVFTSVETMRAWDPVARPVPADARLVALSAGRDGDDVVLDPGSDHVLPLSYSMLAAIATGEPWDGV